MALLQTALGQWWSCISLSHAVEVAYFTSFMLLSIFLTYEWEGIVNSTM